VPHVRHFVPHLEGHVHIRFARPFGQARGIVQQGLGVTDLNQQRRQAGQVGVQRGGQRVLRIGVAQIQLGHAQQALFLYDRIGRRPSRHRLAGALHIDPGRNPDARRRQGLTGIADGQQGGDGQPAAGRIASNGDVCRTDALVEQPAVGGHRIIDRSRKRMLGSQAVVERQHPRPGRL